MKKSKLLLSLLLVNVFAGFSCGGNNTDPYKGDKTVKEGNKITWDGSIKTEYQTGGKIDYGNLVVHYSSISIDPVPRLDPSSSELTVNQYFITVSDTAPTQNRVKENTIFSTGKQSETHDVYIAIRGEDDKIHLSNGIPITVKNEKAINPLVYYIGGPVLIIAVAAIVAFTRKYKQTH